MKKIITITAIALGFLLPVFAYAARTDSTWDCPNGANYCKPAISASGSDILIFGSSKYLNFNAVSGTNGYGFRDNAGTVQFKNSGGSWTNIGSGGGATTWGSITGTLSSQTDLQSALDAKYDASNPSSYVSSGANISNFFNDTGYATSGSNISQFYNDSGYITSQPWDTVTGGINYAGGYVGINTTAPRTSLDIFTSAVNMTSTVGTFVVQGVDQYGQSFVLQSPVDNYTGVIAQTYKAYGAFGGGVLNGAHFTSNTVDYWAVFDSSVSPKLTVTNSTGYVGVGTVNPLGNLDVRISQEGNAALLINYTTGSYLRSGSASTDVHIGDFITRNVLLSETGGNVGIGTTSPSSLLSIGDTGGINFRTATSTFNTTGGIDIASGCFAIAGTCVSGGSGASNFTFASTYGALNAATSSPVWFQGAINASSTLRVKSNLVSTSNAGFLDFQRDAQTAGNGYTLMRIKSPTGASEESTLSLVNDRDNNNAGVNEVFVDFYNENYSDSNQAGIRVFNTGTAPSKPFLFGYCFPTCQKDNNNVFGMLPNGTVFASRATSTVDQNAKMYIASSTATYILKLDAAPGTNKFVFTSGGNFGIGSTTPTYPFSLGTGNLAFSIDSTGKATTSALVVNNGTVGTTTVTIGDIGNPGCVKIRDTGNGGWSYFYVKAGVMTVTTTSCE